MFFGDFDKPAISATSNNGLLTVSQYNLRVWSNGSFNRI
jgi:hypothetical protein